RLAAEILGFIRRDTANTSRLTDEGKAFLHAGRAQKQTLLSAAVLRSKIFQRVVPFLESFLPRGCTRNDLEAFIAEVTEATTLGMIHRRTSSIVAWLQTLNMIKEKHGRHVLQTLPPSTAIMDYTSDWEPLLPTRFQLSEYVDTAERIKSARGLIKSAVRQAQRERASNAHIRLTNLVARKVRAAGSIPRRNRHIDLAASIKQELFIFEIKFLTELNVYSQIRRGISQLYEYRYLQAVPSARLVLVIERPLSPGHQWISDYLINDRRILLAWDSDRDKLHCPPPLRSDLHFLL
ncbi:MAG: hypothetical protein ACE5JC_08590, partial [Candidatus Zixiibacteriota bacterium]